MKHLLARPVAGVRFGSSTKTIEKADEVHYKPDAVLLDSIRRSLTIDATTQVLIDMHRIRKQKGFQPKMMNTVNLNELFFARARSLCDDINAAVTLRSLCYNH